MFTCLEKEAILFWEYSRDALNLLFPVRPWSSVHDLLTAEFRNTWRTEDVRTVMFLAPSHFSVVVCLYLMAQTMSKATTLLNIYRLDPL